MILDLPTFTLVHVVISLVAIAAGLVVLVGLLAGRRRSGWTALFLVTTVATCVTGFMFPFEKVLPSHVVGVITSALLAVAIVARYLRGLAGKWRWIYVASAVACLYLNVFVLVVQVFLKVPALNDLAPTQSEPPFVTTQGAVLVVFIVLGLVAVRRFRNERPVTDSREMASAAGVRD